jgi:hypothetical protein
VTTITNAGPPPRNPGIGLDSCDDPNCVECPSPLDRADAIEDEAMWAYRVDRETTDTPRRMTLTWGSTIRSVTDTPEDIARSVAGRARGMFLTYIGRLHVWVWRITPVAPDLGPDRVDPSAPIPYYAIHHMFEPGTPPLDVKEP